MINHNADLCRVNSRMLWGQVLLRVSFAAFVALERLHPRVLHHVAIQVTRVYASIIALVTLGWLFSSMHPHHMLFQITSCNVVFSSVLFCTGKASPQSASSCGDTGHQSVCKHICTGYTWMAFLQYASSSYALSNH